jgi:hypothetical protein
MIPLTRPPVLEGGKARSVRFDRDFVPIAALGPDPVRAGVGDSSDADQQSAEWVKQARQDGIAGRFWDALAAREQLITRSFPELAWPGDNRVFWHALCELCADDSDQGRYARHVRFVRVREVLRAEREG